jgi:N6-L-threonylcarbamoyladenine synthase
MVFNRRVRILAIESSCDETSAAVVVDGVVRANVVSSQVKLHAEYGGVVPELAAREHLRNLLPVARAALAEAGLQANEIDAVAATQGPGLPAALLVGFQAAQAFAFALGKKFVGVHHHEAHLYSPWIGGEPPRAEFDQFEANVSTRRRSCWAWDIRAARQWIGWPKAEMQRRTSFRVQ